MENKIKGSGQALSNLDTKSQSTFSKMGSSLLKVGGAMAGAFALKSIVGDAVERITNFQKAISSLSAITGKTGADLEGLKSKVLDVAANTKKGASEVAAAFELIGSKSPALLENADGLAAVTEQAIILSKASGEDLEQSASALTGVMNQFNLTAADSERIINSLAAGSQKGAAPVGQIADAIDKFGTTAAQNNITLEQSIGLVETLAEKNIKGAEAGTQARNIILKLKNAGIGFVDGQFDMNAALEEAKNKFDNIQDPVKRSQEQTKLFGLESSTAGAILLDNVDTFNKYTNAVTGTNTANEQAEIQMNNLKGRTEELDATYESFILSLEDGDGVFSRIAQGGVEAFTKILEAATELNNFNFDKLFNPESAEQQNRSLSKLSSTFLTLSGNMSAAETTTKTLDAQSNLLTENFKKQGEEQLKTKEAAHSVVASYKAIGFTTEEAIAQYKKLSGFVESNTNSINANKDSLNGAAGSLRTVAQINKEIAENKESLNSTTTRKEAIEIQKRLKQLEDEKKKKNLLAVANATANCFSFSFG